MARVLIVDDDLRFRRVLHLALDTHGYEVGNAAGGREALLRIGAMAPDLIVLDWHLPDIDGIQICRKLRARCNTPIIMVSGNRSNAKEVALRAGATDFLAKPFSILDLLSRIELALAPRKTKPNQFLTSP